MSELREEMLAMRRFDAKLECPAKLNLSLAVHGKRDDGFHSLSSVVCQLSIHDSIYVQFTEAGEGDSISFNGIEPELVRSGTTVHKALEIARSRGLLEDRSCKILVEKQLPHGAGLGGGSSNGALLLKFLAEEAGQPEIAAMASEIGSDCPMFLNEEPAVMKGRGEILRPLNQSLQERIRGKKVVVFKPPFEINTGEAYARLAQQQLYASEETFEENLLQWAQSDAFLPNRLNSFQDLIEKWLPSLAVAINHLASTYKIDVRLSGSGSACFFFPEEAFPEAEIRQYLESIWNNAFYWATGVVK